MKCERHREQTKFWRLPELGNFELLHANYVTQTFSRHTHECFGIGVIEAGALGFYYRGKNLVATPSTINLVNPGDVHTGHAASDKGWKYRMFYLDPSLLQQAASEVAGRPMGLPYFKEGVIRDIQLARQIHQLHVMLEKPGTSLLEQQSRLLWTLTQFVIRHARDRPVMHKVGREHGSVRKVREYIEANFAENVSLQLLSRIVHLSPFHLLRVFREKVGIPPHAYLTQVRVYQAKELLERGWPIVQAALETGFVDQSHLTRQFKRILGITPGQIQQKHTRQLNWK